MLTYTRFGRYVYMVGGNREAAEYSGVNVKLIIGAVMVIGAVCSGVAGMVGVAYFGSAQQNEFTTYLLDAIAAVVVGGTSLFGGRGGIPNTIVGLFVLGVLNNGLDHVQIDPFLKILIRGLILLAALIINVYAQQAPLERAARPRGRRRETTQRRRERNARQPLLDHDRRFEPGKLGELAEPPFDPRAARAAQGRRGRISASVLPRCSIRVRPTTPGMPGRDEVGDAKRGAERPRPLHVARRGELPDVRAERLVDQPLVPVEIGEREIGPPGVIDADEGGVGDEVEALLAAVFRMRPPADIGEQAGGVAEPRISSAVSSRPIAANAISDHGGSSPTCAGERERSQASSSQATISGSRAFSAGGRRS